MRSSDRILYLISALSAAVELVKQGYSIFSDMISLESFDICVRLVDG